MPCMCGDICCSSCGPAQGNSRCPLCQVWLSEGCEHYEVTPTGDLELKNEFIEAIAEAARKEAAIEALLDPAAEDAYYREEEGDLG